MGFVGNNTFTHNYHLMADYISYNAGPNLLLFSVKLCLSWYSKADSHGNESEGHIMQKSHHKICSIFDTCVGFNRINLNSCKSIYFCLRKIFQ